MSCYPRQAAHGLGCCARFLLMPFGAFVKHVSNFALPCPALPPLKINYVTWSPNSKTIAFTLRRCAPAVALMCWLKRSSRCMPWPPSNAAYL